MDVILTMVDIALFAVLRIMCGVGLGLSVFRR